MTGLRKNSANPLRHRSIPNRLLRILGMIISLMATTPRAYGLLPAVEINQEATLARPAVTWTLPAGNGGGGSNGGNSDNAQVLASLFYYSESSALDKPITNEIRVIRDLTNASGMSVVFIPAHDNATRELLGQDPRIQIIEVEMGKKQAERVLATSQLGQKWIEFQYQIRAGGMGILVSGGVAGAYSVPFYFTSGLESSVSVFLASFATYALQSTFTNQWEKFLNSGAHLADWVLARMQPGKFTSPEKLRNAGRLSTVYAFNAGYMTLIVTLGGVWEGALSIIILAGVTMYDFAWDLALNGYVRDAKLSKETFSKYIRYRMIIGAAIVEPLALVVGSGFQVLLGFITAGGIYTLFNPQSTEAFAKGLSPRLEVKQMLSKIKENPAEFFLKARGSSSRTNMGPPKSAPLGFTFRSVLDRLRTASATNSSTHCRMVFAQ